MTVDAPANPYLTGNFAPVADAVEGAAGLRKVGLSTGVVFGFHGSWIPVSSVAAT